MEHHSPKDMTDFLGDDFEMEYLGSDGGPIIFEKPVVRKPTYVARKEEKESLLKEVDQLQIKIKELEEAERQRLKVELQQQLQRYQQRRALQQQQHSLVDVQSSVTAYVSTQDSLPYEASIVLSRDYNQRRDALLAIKQKALEAWLAYSTSRTRYLDPFRQISETSRFSLDSGDYCALILDQTPLLDTRFTVRQVFDTIIASHSSIDIRITDAFNDITTSDEILYGVDGVRQIRLSSRLACGVDVEMNNINFYQYFEDVGDEYGGGPVGVLSVDFVDLDEMYPYQKSERVRIDASGALVIREHRRMQRNSRTGVEEEERVIVATQTCLYKIHRPEMVLPRSVTSRLREQLGQWGNVVISAVLDQIHGQYGNRL